MPISHQKMRTCQPEKGLVKTISLILPLLNKRSSIKIWWDCNGVRIFNGEEEREGGWRSLQFNSVEERDSGIITTAGAIKAIIEDPLFSILEEDSNKTEPAWQIRGPCFDHNPTSPAFKFFVKNPIPNVKVSVSFTLRFRF